MKLVGKRQISLNVLRVIILLSVLGLLAQIYDFSTQLSLIDTNFLALPLLIYCLLFESWFFGIASSYRLNVHPAWYSLALIVLAIIGLRFGHKEKTISPSP